MLLLVVLVLAAAWWVRRRRSLRRQRALAAQLRTGLAAWPILGHTYRFLGNGADQMETVKDIGRDAIEMGGISKFMYFDELMLCVADPAAAAVIMKECLNKHKLMYIMEILMKHSSVFSSVPIWRPRRKAITPIFSTRCLSKFIENFTENANEMVVSLNQEFENTTFNIWRYTSRYASTSICQNIMGVKMDAEANKFMSAMDVIWNTASYLLFRPWLKPKLVRLIIPTFRNFFKNKKTASYFINKLIKETREANPIIRYPTNDEHANTQNDMPTFLKHQLNAPEHLRLSEDMIFEECITLIVAGSDTSANALAFVAMLLGRYPHVQDKLYTELEEVLGNTDLPVNGEDLPRLIYHEAVIKETLRLYPVFPIVVRQLDRDVELPSGLTAVSGCGVFINIWAVHRHPGYWGEDADLFRPERFLDTALTHPAAFMPFGYGPRKCIGYRYAMMSLQIGLASLVRRYRVLGPAGASREEIPTHFSIILKHAGHYELRLQRRV